MYFRRSKLQIPGQYIVDAMEKLPPCGPASTSQQIGVDVPFWGRFKVTFKPFKHSPQGWPPSWIWLARDVVSDDLDGARN
jgi:hypothetical protein